jgi:hypothetical protein
MSPGTIIEGARAIAVLPSSRWWLVAGCAVLAGCGPRGGPRPVAAGGRVVTAAGAPCGGALVVFHPQAADRVNAAKPVATTADDGSFRLTTGSPDDGAVPGEYGVTVVWPERAKEGRLSLSSEGGGGGPDRLGGRYGNPGRPKIKVTIPPTGDPALTITVEGG